MENRFLHIVILAGVSSVLPFKVHTQWAPQAILLPTPRTGIISMFPVDTNVVWALPIDLTNTSPLGDPIGPMNRFVRTDNGGTSWLQATIPAAAGLHPGSITAIDAQTAWVTMQDESKVTSGGIFKTTDGGTTWLKQSTAFPRPGGKPMFIHFFDANNGLVVGERNPNLWEIYTTTNGGAQWDSVSQTNITPKVAGELLREGFEYTALGNTFWFCTTGSVGRVFKSTNRGINWTAVAVAPGYERVHSIAFQDDSVGLAVAFDDIKATIMKTTNGGSTWFPAAAPTVPTPHIICHVPGTTGVYVVTGHPWPGSNSGSAFTLNGGSSWTIIDNTPHGPVAFIAPNIGWAAGANNSGSYSMFRWSGRALTTSIQFASGEPPKEFRLEQNYPNPFNPGTRIKFHLPAASVVRLEVHNVLGQHIATLLEEKRVAGEYELAWDGQNDLGQSVPSGIYLLSLHAGEFTLTRKMVLAR